jgi:hypothetical protein
VQGIPRAVKAGSFYGRKYEIHFEVRMKKLEEAFNFKELASKNTK